jgi:hypothetical protein
MITFKIVVDPIQVEHVVRLEPIRVILSEESPPSPPAGPRLVIRVGPVSNK